MKGHYCNTIWKTTLSFSNGEVLYWHFPSGEIKSTVFRRAAQDDRRRGGGKGEGIEEIEGEDVRVKEG
jgi:hypothetical protein